MKRNTLIFVFVMFVLSFSFAEKVTVYIGAGSSWVKRAPQCAVWIEEKDGAFVDTLYVTKSANSRLWKFSPKEGRPESLPVWYHASGVNPAIGSEKKFDAVSGATPKQGLQCQKEVSLEKGRTYRIRVELNQSFDYNSLWTKKNSGVNGQPSIIYEARFTAADSIPEVEMHMLGLGSVDGSDGDIHIGQNDFLTSADRIADKIYITFN